MGQIYDKCKTLPQGYMTEDGWFVGTGWKIVPVTENLKERDYIHKVKVSDGKGESLVRASSIENKDGKEMAQSGYREIEDRIFVRTIESIDTFNNLKHFRKVEDSKKIFNSEMISFSDIDKLDKYFFDKQKEKEGNKDIEFCKILDSVEDEVLDKNIYYLENQVQCVSTKNIIERLKVLKSSKMAYKENGKVEKKAIDLFFNGKKQEYGESQYVQEFQPVWNGKIPNQLSDEDRLEAKIEKIKSKKPDKENVHLGALWSRKLADYTQRRICGEEGQERNGLVYREQFERF